MTGRPTDYTDELAQAICEHLAKDNSLRSFCELDGKPSETTVYRWRRENPVFWVMYARAREDQGHTVADKLSDLRKMLEAGKIAPDVANVIRQSIQWEAARRAGKDFGDKMALIGGGPDDPAIKTVREVRRTIIDPAKAQEDGQEPA